MNLATKRTILCVDDDKKNLELLEAYLSPEYKLRFSESVDNALRQISYKEIPDLILLDVMMPGMSGTEVLRRLRADSRTRSIPVIFLTALTTQEERIRGVGAGCDDFITKPFNGIELIARIRSLLNLHLGQKVSDSSERLLLHIFEMSQPMIVCSSDWLITNLNPGAQRYLMPGQGFQDVNFLNFIFKHYAVSVPRHKLQDRLMAPNKFLLEKKDSGGFVIQRAEVNLEFFDNPVIKTTDIILMLRDVLGEAAKSE